MPFFVSQTEHSLYLCKQKKPKRMTLVKRFFSANNCIKSPLASCSYIHKMIYYSLIRVGSSNGVSLVLALPQVQEEAKYMKKEIS